MTPPAPLVCPHLGLRTDRHSVLAEPSDEHRCHVGKRPAQIDEEHQRDYCLARAHNICPLYRAPAASADPPVVIETAPYRDTDDGEDNQPAPSRPTGWIDRIVMIAAVLAVIFAIVYFGALFLDRPVARAVPTVAPAANGQPTVTRTATGTSTPRPTSTPQPTATARPAQSSPGPVGGPLKTLNPLIDDVGWVTNADRLGVHASDRTVQSGVYDGAVYIGLVVFDLTALAPGSAVNSAALELTGAREASANSAGSWTLRYISLPPGTRLSSLSFDDVRSLKWDYVLQPSLTASALGQGKVNRFELTGPVLEALQRGAGESHVLFRIDGPSTGADDVFAWESGAGGSNVKPSLVLSVSGAAPAPVSMVVVACVPTPSDPAARAAVEATATYVAQTFGTPTPYPPNYVTPIPVTATPTPASVFAAATAVARATEKADQEGTATPTPVNWVVPPIITATPIPANQATAVYQRALATAMAATTGTPTPFPCYVSIVPYGSPTPPIVAYNLPTPTPTPVPTLTPASIPAAVRNKIVFASDREGAPAVYVMEGDGSRVGRLNDRWAYDVSSLRQSQSSQYRLVVIGQPTVMTRIELIDLLTQRVRILVQNDRINYDPAFAPNGYDLAYVSTLSGHDEIYRINTDSGGAQQLTFTDWEWNKRPSWSPDGRQIVFWSNRVSGRKQIWRMNADGSGLVNLSNNGFNDWDPVWIR